MNLRSGKVKKEYKVTLRGEFHLYTMAESEDEARENAEYEIWEDLKEAIRAYEVDEIKENEE